MDLDDSKIDDDLDKLLQHIKEDQQNSMDAPDSPKDPGETSHRYVYACCEVYIIIIIAQ